MSSVNYSLNNRGVRLIGTPEAWVKTKNVWYVLSLAERFIRKTNISFLDLIIKIVVLLRKIKVKAINLKV